METPVVQMVRENSKLFEHLICKSLEILQISRLGHLKNLEEKIDDRKMLIKLITYRQKEFSLLIKSKDLVDNQSDIKKLEILSALSIKKVLEIDEEIKNSLEKNLISVREEITELQINKSKIKKFKTKRKT